MSTTLPFEITDAIVQCFGKAFHFKDNVAAFMLSCQVPHDLVHKHKDLPKYVWARRVLADLVHYDNGILVQRRILTELCKLKNIPDQNVPNRNDALDSLRRLQQLAKSHDLLATEEKKSNLSRRDINDQKQKILQQRAIKLEEIRSAFNEGISNPNRQQAGYTLEDILFDLFSLSEIEYRRPYRTSTQQIDGSFRLDGFDYLVEAKWRKDYPNEQEIGGFKHKIDTKLESTRGFYLSVSGYRDEVLREFNGRGCKIIFMFGLELSNILEGRISLIDALREKVKKAAQEGISFYQVLN